MTDTPQAADLHAAARAATDALRRSAPDVRRRLMVELVHPAPQVRANSEDLRRLVEDLVTHAARHVHVAAREPVGLFLTVRTLDAFARVELKVPQAEPALGVEDPGLGEALRLLALLGGRLSYASSPEGGITIAAEVPRVTEA